MECSPCSQNLSTTERKKAIKELTHGREFVNKLHLLLQNQNPLGENGMVVADDLVTKILTSFSNVLLVLKTSDHELTGSDLCQSPLTTTSSPLSDNRKSVDSKRKTPAVKDKRGGYKRRKSSAYSEQIAAKPTEDPYAWRKYGQKEILNAKYPRNYFRCTHKIDQGCQATKQVQQIDDEPPMYQTTYMGKHTCTDPLKPLQLILDSSPTPTPTTPTNSNNIFTLFPSFPPVKLEFPTEDELSPSDQYHYSPDLTGFESGPTTLLASSSGSNHGDIYSCTTSSRSLDVDLMVGNVDFDDDMFINEALFGDH